MSTQDSSSLHPLVMETEATEDARSLDSSEKQAGTFKQAATAKMLGINTETGRTKFLSPIPSYETDRYRLASPHSSKI